jgi:hypothetical protein
MPKVFHFVCFAALLTSALAASAQVEVLYVTGPQASTVPLDTYNVNSETAIATQVGSIKVGGSSVAPVTVGTQHLIYVWNSTDVWMYPTTSQGVPESKPSQHLTFTFPHPVTSFVADPRGNFAYAGLTWFDSKYNNYAAVVLFTIDQATGKLTNTLKQVASYGPDQYVSLNFFVFGASGGRLYAYFFNGGPYTCIQGYDYYNVNQTNGSLSSRNTLTFGSADCNVDGAIAITDQLTASDSSCCGTGFGNIDVHQTNTGQNIYCKTADLTLCGDNVYKMYIDPSSQNLFFGDGDTQLTDVVHFDFTNLKLIETGSAIPGNPPIFFSPDSSLVYAVNSTDIGIYAFQPNSGLLGANTSIPAGNKINLATATLQ